MLGQFGCCLCWIAVWRSGRQKPVPATSLRGAFVSLHCLKHHSIHTCSYILYIYIHIYIHIYKYTYTHIYIYICRCMRCIYRYICTCVYAECSCNPLIFNIIFGPKFAICHLNTHSAWKGGTASASATFAPQPLAAALESRPRGCIKHYSRFGS